VLPAKDTGILKKRCYMLGLDVRQCSELQRDFLIRYVNAAKSKSTVVVSRHDAITLIGFYVTPKSAKTRDTPPPPPDLAPAAGLFTFVDCFDDDDWVKKCMEYEVEGPRPRGRPKRTWREVVQEDCQAGKLNKEDAMVRCKWRKVTG